jgi:methylamine---glutamate N-methyltransferase subunit C
MIFIKEATMKAEDKMLKDTLKYIAGGVAGLIGTTYAIRKGVDLVHDTLVKIVMTDVYDENMLELFSAASRVGPQIIMEANLRAEDGKVLQRPLGPPKKFPSLESIMFSIASLHIMPTPLEAKIDTKVTIGKRAKKPFAIDLPIMVAPMAYGVALSEAAKIALSRGATYGGTAFCTGEGPYLESERKNAKTYIYQYHRGCWDKTPEILGNCEGIEIQLGQGAIGGVGHKLEAKDIDKTLRKAFKFKKGQDAVAHSRQPEVNNPKDLERLVEKLKRMSGGVPIGVKMGAGKYLEADLDWVCSSGADYVVVEGAEAASKGSAPILQDDFGVPTVFAVSRAAEWL